MTTPQQVFEQAFSLTVAHEGGYVNDPADPGGETKFGISKRSYPDEDIPNMTLERAKLLYRRDYWDRMHCAAMHPSIGFALFDAGVNCGCERAATWLQQLVGAIEDGRVGPRTLASVAQASGPLLAAKLNAKRLAYCAGLPTWNRFGKGWALRLARNILSIHD